MNRPDAGLLEGHKPKDPPVFESIERSWAERDNLSDLRQLGLASDFA